MLILGIETSCDETSAAVIKPDPHTQNIAPLSNVVSSSIEIHKKTGGIIPENAAREQIKYIVPVIQKAISTAGKLQMEDIDSIAVTVGPGLVGSLLVGVETAKTLAYIYNKPVVSVNHLIGHIYANFVGKTQNSKLKSQIEFPAIGLIVSGGHTDLILMKGHGKIKWLGGTRDDAAGEALDKIGRLLGLPYPAGPEIEKLAKEGNPKKFNFPRPLMDSSDFDFSFSGLKTAVAREIHKIKNKGVAREEGIPTARREFGPTGPNPNEHWREGNPRQDPEVEKQINPDLCASVQEAVVDVLVSKTLKAAKLYKVQSILLGGGVAANTKLREQFQMSLVNAHMSNVKFFVPDKKLCTDNAAMIASVAYYNYKPADFRKITANPNLHLR